MNLDWYDGRGDRFVSGSEIVIIRENIYYYDKSYATYLSPQAQHMLHSGTTYVCSFRKYELPMHELGDAPVTQAVMQRSVCGVFLWAYSGIPSSIKINTRRL